MAHTVAVVQSGEVWCNIYISRPMHFLVAGSWMAGEMFYTGYTCTSEIGPMQCGARQEGATVRANFG